MTPEEAREMMAKAQAVLAEQAVKDKAAAEAAEKTAKVTKRLEEETIDWSHRKRFFESVLAELVKLDPEAKLKAVEPSIRLEAENSWNAVNPGQLSISSGDYSYRLGFSKEYTSSWNRSRPKWRCTVGDVGSRRSFPEKTVGGFNFLKIAEAAFQQKTTLLAQRREYELKKTASEASKEIVSRLNKRFKFGEYFGPFSYSTRDGSLVKLQLGFNHELTESQAIQIYEAWQAFQVVVAEATKKPA